MTHEAPVMVRITHPLPAHQAGELIVVPAPVARWLIDARCAERYDELAAQRRELALAYRDYRG